MMAICLWFPPPCLQSANVPKTMTDTREALSGGWWSLRCEVIPQPIRGFHPWDTSLQQAQRILFSLLSNERKMWLFCHNGFLEYNSKVINPIGIKLIANPMHEGKLGLFICFFVCLCCCSESSISEISMVQCGCPASLFPRRKKILGFRGLERQFRS